MNPFARNLKLKLYPAVDSAMQPRIAAMARQGMPVTCTVGCDACCHQIVYITEPEAQVLAAELLRDAAALDLALPRLRAQALAVLRYGPVTKTGLDADEMDKAGYWTERVPCAFLVDHRCSLYSSRPFACRTYYAVSDPALCNGPVDSKVGYIDTMDLTVTQLRFATAARSHAPAPLQLCVLWALERAAANGSATWAKIRTACAGVMKPEAWCAIVHGDGWKVVEESLNRPAGHNGGK